ncbi:hypothetical protein Gotur_011523 [Gossypium turneri]
MSVIGEAALSEFLDLLLGKSLDSALKFVANHNQLHQQLKQWQSILPDIQGCSFWVPGPVGRQIARLCTQICC